MFDGRVLAAALFVAAAVIFALRDDRRAWRRLLLGAILAAPVLAVGAWLLLGSGLNWLMAPAETFGGIVRIVAGIVGALAVAILASVSVHSIIGAFESRLPAWPDEQRSAERKAAAVKEPA